MFTISRQNAINKKWVKICINIEYLLQFTVTLAYCSIFWSSLMFEINLLRISFVSESESIVKIILFYMRQKRKL